MKPGHFIAGLGIAIAAWYALTGRGTSALPPASAITPDPNLVRPALPTVAPLPRNYLDTRTDQLRYSVQ